MGDGAAFQGAKAALFLGDRLVVILRDDRPDIPYPGHWDLPGGGRERNESPFDCIARECREELGLTVRAGDVAWSRAFHTGGILNWFFLAHMSEDAAARIVFGDEGQGWRMMSARDYIAHPLGIRRFQDRLSLALRELESPLLQESPPLP